MIMIIMMMMMMIMVVMLLLMMMTTMTMMIITMITMILMMIMIITLLLPLLMKIMKMIIHSTFQIGPSATVDTKPVIFIEAMAHAREWLAGAATLYFIDEVTTTGTRSIQRTQTPPRL